VTRRDEVVEIAERLLEAEGPDALTMRRLAEEMGMRAPSLYKHVAGKHEIVTALQARALRDQARAFAGARSLPALAAAYRAWAVEHPRLYELTARHSLDRDALPPGVEAAAAEPLLRVTGGDVARARALWGMAHGLVDLELTGRFPADADIDAAWAAAVAGFDTIRS
jgi:AcrR family transcriptional regulator